MGSVYFFLFHIVKDNERETKLFLILMFSGTFLFLLLYVEKILKLKYFTKNFIF